jgi:methionyl-tRNA formyltransferase
LIEAAGLMLNYHTGISPIYNGSYTIYWTYANRQPQITGGTLMYMSPVVDGGNILAHYLPQIEADDTPGVQFLKTMIGGVELYNEFLDDVASGKDYIQLPQGRPFKVYYGYEWTAAQTIAIERAIKRKVCSRHIRDEIVREYWRAADKPAAMNQFKKTLLELVYDG